MEKEIDLGRRIEDFNAKMRLPYHIKVEYAKLRAKEFVRECDKRGLEYYVSVGGLDSITLLCFLRSLHIDCPAVSVSFLEDVSIQKIHTMLGVEKLLPSVREIKPSGEVVRWTKHAVLQELGFPVISKEIAEKIEMLQNPTPKNAASRHAAITGERKCDGGYRKASGAKLPQRWLELFGGYENDAEGVEYKVPPFRVSERCCYYLKEKPCMDWEKEHHAAPFLGLMASEGGRRARSLKANGCNLFGRKRTRSAPFAIFGRQDVLQLALDLHVPVPEIYGEIQRKSDGTLYTTKAQRTGCSICGFGIHLEKRPHKLDLLFEKSPKEWHYWMYECCTDEKGERYGWARVLEYIGVEYLPIEQQTTLFDGIEKGE